MRDCLASGFPARSVQTRGGREGMRLSVVLSVHNRTKLLRRALDSYVLQTLPPREWEVILVDDMSTEDLSTAYRDLLGKLNVTHVKMDHTRHAVFQERNPNWKRED